MQVHSIDPLDRFPLLAYDSISGGQRVDRFHPCGLEEKVALPPASTDILQDMASHTRQLRSMYRSLPGSSASTASTSSSSSISTSFCGHDDADPELASGQSWPNLFASKRRRQTRRTSILLISILIGCGVGYTLVDNFLLDDWVSARSRYTPVYLPSVSQVPDYPDGALGTSPRMGQGVVRVPFDESHVLVPNPAILPPAPELLSPIKRFPPAVLTDYYVSGLLASSPIPYPTMDILYTFVNASSPVLLEAKDERAAEEGLGHLIGAARHWRDNGELRGAIRSAVQNLGAGLRRVHVLSADFELDSEFDDLDDELDADETLLEPEVPWRVGQVPSWLNTTSADAHLQWHFHSEVFRLPSDEGRVDDRVAWDREEEWRDQATPSFNSMQIEGRAGWVKDLSEQFIFSNDDMFFFRKLALSDFHHPVLGPVFRLEPAYSLRVPSTLSPALRSDSGEWGGLQHANSLLSTRFYPKRRMYMTHVPKAMTRTMAHEASIMFAREWTVAGTRGFRESRRGEADIHFSWLVTHLHIERWREALLWTWAVARLGEDGMWGKDAKEELRRVLRLDGSQTDQILVLQNERDTLFDMEDIMVQQDWEFPRGSNYLFTSMDGHLPDNPSSEAPLGSCAFSLSRCLPPNFLSNSESTSAVDAFTHLAFVEPNCGDCLIMALVNASGRRGLSAFLPSEMQTFAPEKRERRMWERTEPMLPLVNDWRLGDFSLRSVVRPGQDVWEEARSEAVNLRAYCVKLLSRYTYSLAQSPTVFTLAQSTFGLLRSLDNFESSPNIAMGCLNDDQPDLPGSDTEALMSKNIFGQWMEKRFGAWEAPWERPNWNWTVPLQEGNSLVPSPLTAAKLAGENAAHTATGGTAMSGTIEAAKGRLKQPVQPGGHGQAMENTPHLASLLEALSKYSAEHQPVPLFTGGHGQG